MYVVEMILVPLLLLLCARSSQQFSHGLGCRSSCWRERGSPFPAMPVRLSLRLLGWEFFPSSISTHTQLLPAAAADWRYYYSRSSSQPSPFSVQVLPFVRPDWTATSPGRSFHRAAAITGWVPTSSSSSSSTSSFSSSSSLSVLCSCMEKGKGKREEELKMVHGASNHEHSYMNIVVTPLKNCVSLKHVCIAKHLGQH